MQHSFDVDIATEYGVNCAILLNHIWFWCEKNKANGKHEHDGLFWTYNSVKAFEDIFPYMSEKTIRNTLNKLKEEGLIEVGCFNESGYDRTKWYAVTQLGYSHLVKRANGFSKKGEPIPDIYTDRDIINNTLNINNTHINNNNISYAQKRKMEVDALFEKLWKMYPKKMGKNSVTKTAKERLFKVGEEEMIRCIERYKEETKGKDKQYIMYGSTFFNKGYENYRDEAYADYIGQPTEISQKIVGGIQWQ